MKNPSRGARQCFRVLQSYASGPKGCIPSQKRIAQELDCGLRTVQRYIAQLVEIQWINVYRDTHQAARYEIKSRRQNGGCSYDKMAGARDSILLTELTTIESKTTPAREADRSEAPVEESTPINALALTVSDAEYIAFCRQCARERLSIPSREDAAKVKAKYVGTWNGSPAWLQLRAFPKQWSTRLWMSLAREQVLMEMERQALTPPEMTKHDRTMDAVRRRLLEGNK